MKLDKLINSAGKGTSEATACRRIANPYSITMGEIIKILKAGLIDKADFYAAVETEMRRKTK